jgi:hypothetical protein
MPHGDVHICTPSRPRPSGTQPCAIICPRIATGDVALIRRAALGVVVHVIAAIRRLEQHVRTVEAAMRFDCRDSGTTSQPPGFLSMTIPVERVIASGASSLPASTCDRSIEHETSSQELDTFR